MRELLVILNRREVSFLICGGHALAFHGYPRLTMDLDIFILPSKDNARKVMNALNDFGFGNAGIPSSAFETPGTAVTLGVQPNQIDLLTPPGDVTDEKVFDRGVPGDLNGATVKFISKPDLIMVKKLAGRKKDLADIEELEKP